MDISVIIVNYNTKDLLLECLGSIRKQSGSVNHELIVVDNASGDGSREAVTKLFPEAKLISSPANIGFGAANNLGAETARGEFLFFLNSDTLLKNDALDYFLRFMRTPGNAGVAACGGNLYNLSGRPAWSHGHFPSWQALMFSLGPKWVFPGLYRRKYSLAERREVTLPVAVDYICGADLFVRKGTFSQLGGFNPAFFLYYEETDFCWRIKEAGGVCVMIPGPYIIHHEATSPNPRRLALLHQAQKTYFDLHFSGVDRFLASLLLPFVRLKDRFLAL